MKKKKQVLAGRNALYPSTNIKNNYKDFLDELSQRFQPFKIEVKHSYDSVQYNDIINNQSEMKELVKDMLASNDTTFKNYEDLMAKNVDNLNTIFGVIASNNDNIRDRLKNIEGLSMVSAYKDTTQKKRGELFNRDPVYMVYKNIAKEILENPNYEMLKEFGVSLSDVLQKDDSDSDVSATTV